MLDRNRVSRPEKPTALVAAELRCYGIDITALSDARLVDEGSLEEGVSVYMVLLERETTKPKE